MDQGRFKQWADAFAERHRKWLLAVLRPLCRNRSEAEDLTQESITRLYEHFGQAPTLPNELVCKKWSVRTANHLLVDQFRKQRVHDKNCQDPNLRNQVTDEPAPPSAFEAVTAERLSEALQALSPELRETYLLHEAGWKYKDIARRLDIKSGTVSKRIHDARRQLRKRLKPTDSQPTDSEPTDE